MSLTRDFEHPQCFVDVTVVRQGVNLTLTAADDPSKTLVCEMDEERAIDIAAAILFRIGGKRLAVKQVKSGGLDIDYTLASEHPFLSVWMPEESQS